MTRLKYLLAVSHLLFDTVVNGIKGKLIVHESVSEKGTVSTTY